MTRDLRAIVVTGLSGSGKSTALGVLEDLGFYCVDNLPVALLPRFVELWRASDGEFSRAAFGIDVRAGHFLDDVPRVFQELRAGGVELEVLYLEASDDVLVRRYSETRRRHPAEDASGIAGAIRRERALLQALRERADRIVDTSAFTVHELRDRLRELIEGQAGGPALTVTLVSFGYKYGLPIDLDLAFDCRFLPNPFFVDTLRPRTGTDPEVTDYVLASDGAEEFLQHVGGLLRFTLPRYQREGKTYLTAGIGCTGGRHRSVVLVEALRARLADTGYRIMVRHRDMAR
jgi:UPF0042 nucleotide-binding protein